MDVDSGEGGSYCGREGTKRCRSPSSLSQSTVSDSATRIIQPKSSQPILDVEPHRVIFGLAPLYELDLRLSGGGKLIAVQNKIHDDTPLDQGRAATKSLDPDGGTAEWRLKSEEIIIRVPWKE